MVRGRSIPAPKTFWYLSEKIDARQAETLGLINRVFPADRLEEETMEIASRIAHGPTVAYRYMKENIARAVGGDMGECLDLEATHHVHTSLTRDHKEAVKAFVEKKTPVFEGR